MQFKHHLTLLVLSTITFGASAASFDCVTASHTVEKLICASGELNRLDEDMASAFKDALLTNTAELAEIKAAQREWIRTTRKCADEVCVHTHYEERLKVLNELIASQPKERAFTNDKAQSTTKPASLNEAKPAKSGDSSLGIYVIAFVVLGGLIFLLKKLLGSFRRTPEPITPTTIDAAEHREAFLNKLKEAKSQVEIVKEKPTVLSNAEHKKTQTILTSSHRVVYKFTPLEKKSIFYSAEMYRRKEDDLLSWFNVEDHYRWGRGFISGENNHLLPSEGDETVHCELLAGWGAELDDQVMVNFEFSENITDKEQEEIKTAYRDRGMAWLLDGGHDWLVEDDAIVVLAPFKVDLYKYDETLIAENIDLSSLNVKSTNEDFGRIGFEPESTAIQGDVSIGDEIDVDKSLLEGCVSIKKARDNSVIFDTLMQDIGFDGFDVLGFYFKEDPRYDAEGYTGLAGAWATCMAMNRDGKSQKILNTLQNFQQNPDVYTLWKYALLNQYAATDLEVLPKADFPSPFRLLEATGGGSVNQCVELMREIKNYFQSKEVSEQLYQDAMKSLVLCYLAAAFNDDDTLSRISELIHLIGRNESIDGVSFEGTSWGEGEHMQGCRRVIEEFTEIRLEVPDGIDVESDGYLDLVDWDAVAERIYLHLA